MGIEGIFGNGGIVACGTFGMVGMEGRGGSVAVGLGRFGKLVGKGGKLFGWGIVGIEGIGKLLGILGMFGNVGCVVWRRWRAASTLVLISMFETVKAIRNNAVSVDFPQEEAMVELYCEMKLCNQGGDSIRSWLLILSSDENQWGFYSVYIDRGR